MSLCTVSEHLFSYRPVNAAGRGEALYSYPHSWSGWASKPTPGHPETPESPVSPAISGRLEGKSGRLEGTTGRLEGTTGRLEGTFGSFRGVWKELSEVLGAFGRNQGAFHSPSLFNRPSLIVKPSTFRPSASSLISFRRSHIDFDVAPAPTALISSSIFHPPAG